MKNLSQSEFTELLANDQQAVVIDVRQPDEWAEGIIEGALLMNVMDIGTFEKEANQLETNKNYYVYCRSGQRSIRACQRLEAIGFGSTYNILGGFLEWKGTKVIPQVTKI